MTIIDKVSDYITLSHRVSRATLFYSLDNNIYSISLSLFTSKDEANLWFKNKLTSGINYNHYNLL